MKKFFLPMVIIGGLICFFSCTKDHASLPVAPSSCTASMVYNLRVKNILDTYCTQPNIGLCHDAASSGGGGSYGPVYLYDSAHSVYAFQSQTALACIKGTGAYLMPPTAYYSVIPANQQVVPADSVTVLQCWAESNGYR
jgi:hypothetical protein